MRIIIHGGRHKTGTTSLQMAMAKSRSALASMGISYPNLPSGQHSELINAKEPNWTPDSVVAAREAAAQSGAHTLFLSAEEVSTMCAEQMQRLGDAFRGDELSFVFCFRHWHSFWPSRWAQNSRRRDSQGFESYLEMVETPELAHPDLNFHLVIERALAVPNASVKAVSFDRAVTSPAGLLSTMLRAAGLADDTIAAVLRNETRENGRMQWQKLEVIRHLNGVVAHVMKLPQDDLCLAAAQHRQPRGFLELNSKWRNIDPAIAGELCHVMDQYRTEVVVDRSEALARTIEQLDQYASLFVNAVGSQVFDVAPPARLTATTLDWRKFSRRYESLTNEALRQIMRVGRRREAGIDP